MGGESTPDVTTTAPTTEASTPAETSTETGTAATATETAEPTAAGTETYVAPITPNRPTQTSDEERNRIKSGTFINKTEAQNGSGYTDFDVQIRANTSMPDVDPSSGHGDVEGEPYAVVIINGELVERSPYFEMKDDGVFNISVHPDGLRHAGIEPGTLEVKVLLMDQDGSRDDVFGTWNGTIEYAGYDGAA